MSLFDSLAYFLPLCLFVGLTTAMTRSDAPRTIIRLAVKFSFGLALGLAALATLLTVLNQAF